MKRRKGKAAVIVRFKAYVRALLFVGMVAVAGTLLSFFAFSTLVSQSPERKVVLIGQGDRLRDVVAKLEAAGALKHPRVFVAWAYFTRRQNSLKSGEYEIPARASTNRILKMMANGRAYNRLATIPEGLTAKQATALFMTFEELEGPMPKIRDGEILPQTYFYTRGQTRSDLVGKMKRARDAALEYEWNNRADGLPLKTKEEALVLASIIEKETSVDEERPLVAAVFVGRLKRGMKLQSDSTVVYAITKGLGDMKGRKLYSKDLKVVSPYNTYANRGLPPAPINNPGLASIRAALNPAQADYLYFVADGTGGHKFSSDLKTHERNRAEWRKIRDN